MGWAMRYHVRPGQGKPRRVAASVGGGGGLCSGFRKGATMSEITAGAAPGVEPHDRDYTALLGAIARRLAAAEGPVFTTDADVPDGAPADGRRAERRDALFDLLLESLEPALRPQYTCSACRVFVRRFGGLVTLDDKGRATPLLWAAEDGGEAFGGACAALRARVAKARVTGVFLHDAKVWGTPEAGGWRHFGGPVHPARVFAHGLLTPAQRMAELAHDFETLERALGVYDRAHVQVALRLLEGDRLYRSEKVLGVAQWLDRLMEGLPKPGRKKSGKKKKGGKKARLRRNLLWRAVAAAPPGFCHVRSTMIGTLLDDIAAGKRYADVERAFRAKMHPLQYQRPQAAPKAGNVKQAEAIVEKLGSAGALKRRFARLDDLELLWRAPQTQRAGPTSIGAAAGRVFEHLLSGRRGAPALDGLPTQTVTWVKFRRTVLPRAGRIEIDVPERGGFYAFVTAADPEAPPVVQWDRADARNPVTWYTYMEPRPATQWDLEPGWRAVTGVCLFPHMWGEDEDGHSHQGKGALMVIDGCRAPKGGGSGLFPEFLRSEYRAVRATLEAFSKASELGGRDAASACGLAVRPGVRGTLRLRVHPPEGDVGGAAVYVIDRWD